MRIESMKNAETENSSIDIFLKIYFYFFSLYSLFEGDDGRIWWCLRLLVLGLLCPKSSRMYLRLTPLSNRWVWKVCLKEWMAVSFFIPAFSHAFSKIFCAVFIVRCSFFLCPGKSHSLGLYVSLCFFRVSSVISERTV